MNAEELKIQLKKHFGFSAFKGLQESVITHILEKEDCFVIMPTGGGKSLLLSAACTGSRRHRYCSVSTYRFNEKSSGCHTGNFLRKWYRSCTEFIA